MSHLKVNVPASVPFPTVKSATPSGRVTNCGPFSIVNEDVCASFVPLAVVERALADEVAVFLVQ